jgi:hypothetical protein
MPHARDREDVRQTNTAQRPRHPGRQVAAHRKGEMMVPKPKRKRRSSEEALRARRFDLLHILFELHFGSSCEVQASLLGGLAIWTVIHRLADLILEAQRSKMKEVP